MVWTAPMTAIPGDVFTAAQFNTHLRDNLNYLKTQTDTNASSIGSLTSSLSTANTNITNLTNWTRRGTQNVTFTNQNAASFSVSFGYTFPSIPAVSSNINHGGTESARWSSKAYNITTTGCDVVVAAPTASTSSWAAIPVTWIAVYRP